MVCPHGGQSLEETLRMEDGRLGQPLTITSNVSPATVPSDCPQRLSSVLSGCLCPQEKVKIQDSRRPHHYVLLQRSGSNIIMN
jgi:hypothetical protein